MPAGADNGTTSRLIIERPGDGPGPKFQVVPVVCAGPAQDAPESRPSSSTAAAIGHASDYRWLCGELQSVGEDSCRLRYAARGDIDRFGGSVILCGIPRLAEQARGAIVRVEGHMADPSYEGPEPRYSVERIQLVRAREVQSPGDHAARPDIIVKKAHDAAGEGLKQVSWSTKESTAGSNWQSTTPERLPSLAYMSVPSLPKATSDAASPAPGPALTPAAAVSQTVSTAARGFLERLGECALVIAVLLPLVAVRPRRPVMNMLHSSRRGASWAMRKMLAAMRKMRRVAGHCRAALGHRLNPVLLRLLPHAVQCPICASRAAAKA
jgi:hypothetical protein